MTNLTKLRAEIKRLRDAIDDAPHDRHCKKLPQFDQGRPRQPLGECNCWKAALKQGSNSDE